MFWSMYGRYIYITRFVLIMIIIMIKLALCQNKSKISVLVKKFTGFVKKFTRLAGLFSSSMFYIGIYR